MDTPTWKMLVYISADNTLYNDALVSLRQLTAASSQNKVEIIVQLDGPSSDQVSRYKCAGGRKELLWQAPEAYTTCRDKRLQHFLGFKDKNDPTSQDALNSYAKPSKGQQVFLDLWGHGAGLDHLFFYTNPLTQTAPSRSFLPLRVISVPGSQTSGARRAQRRRQRQMVGVPGSQTSDAEEANRYVTNIQLKDILSGFCDKFGRKIDLLGLDSCLMGMVEICDEVSESVSIMVASDEEVPNGSWPYDTILKDLNDNPKMDASTLSTSIVERFVEKYTSQNPQTRVSLSAMDLSQNDAVVAGMKALVKALNDASTPDADEDGTVKRAIFRARDASRTPDEVTYIDLGVFCDELTQSFPANPKVSEPANIVRNLLLQNSEPYILHHKDAGEVGLMRPTGLAIYFPPTLDLITSEIDKDLGQQPLPPDKEKFPPAVKTKFEDGSEITGYEILWNDYKALDFNSDKKTGTGWADLIYRLLGGTDQAAAQSYGITPKQSLIPRECEPALAT